MTRRPALLLCAAILALSSCASIGPATVRRDQVDYADAVSEAAKRQLLLNLLKLRYGDTPNFVTLSQLVAGYTLEGRLSIGGDFDRNALVFGHNFDLGVGGTFADHPTATYTPLQGAAFAELMLKPISPQLAVRGDPRRRPAADRPRPRRRSDQRPEQRLAPTGRFSAGAAGVQSGPAPAERAQRRRAPAVALQIDPGRRAGLSGDAAPGR